MYVRYKLEIFTAVRRLSAPSAYNTQMYMAYIMPLFALTGLYWPFGLVLSGNILAIYQPILREPLPE